MNPMQNGESLRRCDYGSCQDEAVTTDREGAWCERHSYAEMEASLLAYGT